MEQQKTKMIDAKQIDWYYKVLDVPPMPEGFEERLWQLYLEPNKDHKWINYWGPDKVYNDQLRPDLATKPGSGDVVGIRNGERVENARGRRYVMDDDIVAWINEHVHDNYNDVGLFIMDGTENHTMLPHSDQTRNFVAIYMIEPGGTDVYTGYWQEHGYPLIREHREFGLDYSKLDLRYKVQWPKGKWAVMNTNILHSVENMTGVRVAIQMGLLEFPKAPVTYTEYI